MIIHQEELTKINHVQVGIFKEIIRVCEKLGITYFMVHGSLLGAIRNAGFIPLDDDIDIAIPREQYERFLREAPGIIDDRFFVQSNASDEEYPLEFAKVRDSSTTYIAGVLRKRKINHGIFVDVFPIDNCKKGKPLSSVRLIIKKVLDIRVGCIYYDEMLSLKRRLRNWMAYVLCPSWRFAVKQREKLIKSSKKSPFVCITGGKATEKHLPAEWFDGTEVREFEGMSVFVPKEYDKYLSRIYGDYKMCTLVENKISTEDTVEINAILVDVNKPFTEYVCEV